MQMTLAGCTAWTLKHLKRGKNPSGCSERVWSVSGKGKANGKKEDGRKRKDMTCFKGQTSPLPANYRAETWVEFALPNVGLFARHGQLI